ncbi:hypothetical protein OESDEN_09989 [Oesophagostomum dentatum]|uniref:ShKT domain-containing protein n=1 Tax=Oesophagostomum dentatum TaxID=61180 RepID=A0A0B1T485_OESDE|nr:hypothetical protein OESDEN_09989 [Oesophagostomum dentatum]
MLFYAFAFILFLNLFTQSVFAQPCKDVSPTPLCKKLKAQNKCKQDLVIRHYACKKTCGYCRISADVLAQALA